MKIVFDATGVPAKDEKTVRQKLLSYVKAYYFQ